MTKARDIADSELGSLTVDTDTLVVDETNNRVGIGTSSPSQALDVNGTSNATNLTRGGSQVYSRDNILGTVSESGGVPTGAIIERGSNANGEFVKYADGTMICKMSDLVQGGTIEKDLTYPATFRIPGANRRLATRSITHAVDLSHAVYDSTSNSATFVNRRVEATALTVNNSSPFNTSVTLRFNNLTTTSSRYQDISVVAIGRWY